MSEPQMIPSIPGYQSDESLSLASLRMRFPAWTLLRQPRSLDIDAEEMHENGRGKAQL